MIPIRQISDARLSVDNRKRGQMNEGESRESLPDRARLAFEREKWEKEVEFRNRELSLREHEQELSARETSLKEDEARKSRFWNPLVLAVVAAALAATGNAVVTVINGHDQRGLESQKDSSTLALETMKAEAARVLEVIKTADPDKAATNLQFLLDTGLLSDKRTATSITAYLASRKPGQGAALPSLLVNSSTPSHALADIVLDKCVTNWLSRLDPTPCAFVSLEGGMRNGFTVLKNVVGRSKYVVIPTAQISGIEDPVLLASDAPNYWQDAWSAKRFVDQSAGKTLTPDEIGLAVNSSSSVTQSILHIYISCISSNVKEALSAHSNEIGSDWALLGFKLAGHSYRAIRVPGPNLDTNLFALLANRIPAAASNMKQQTLVVTGDTDSGGRVTFIVLNDQVSLASGDRAAGEELLDSDCSGVPK
jgi:CDP-diacylglycerol pyrophosphatase